MSKRMYYYRVGIGYAGVSLHYYLVKAQNELDARSYAIGNLLNPDGPCFDHIDVVRIPRTRAMQYAAFSTCPIAKHKEV